MPWNMSYLYSEYSVICCGELKTISQVTSQLNKSEYLSVSFVHIDDVINTFLSVTNNRVDDENWKLIERHKAEFMALIKGSTRISTVMLPGYVREELIASKKILITEYIKNLFTAKGITLISRQQPITIDIGSFEDDNDIEYEENEELEDEE